MADPKATFLAFAKKAKAKAEEVINSDTVQGAIVIAKEEGEKLTSEIAEAVKKGKDALDKKFGQGPK